MQPSTTLLRPEPYSLRATTTSSHPQLRDLLAYIPEAGIAGGIASVCYDSICTVDGYASAPPEYTPLKFSPSVIASGMGLIAAGGQSSELALKSATPGSDWCFQHLPTASLATATGVRTLHSGSINNGIFICPSPTSPETPRVLVSSNDEAIKVFEVEGRPPDYRAARRRRERERRAGWSVVEATWAAERGEQVCGPAAGAGPSRLTRASHAASGAESDSEGDSEGEEDAAVEEHPSYDEGSACRLVPRTDQDIRLSTAVNHCSVSPDGKWLLAVGDTNEVFLYSSPRSDSDQYELAHTFTASRDASFSTDWNEDNRTFAVASQDGFVHVFDIRSLPSSSRPASPTLRAASSSPRKVAELKTSQSGPAGAARKVKFSPGGRKIDAGLMAFTEHRNRVHVVDARTFETYQILDVPLVSPATATASARSPSSPTTLSWNPSYVPSTALPPPLRPRPQPPPPSRTFRSQSSLRPSLSRLPSGASFTSLASFDAAGGDSGTCTPRDEKERDELEREMRERSERRAREEDRRVRALANEIRRERRRRLVGESRRQNEAAAAEPGTGAGAEDEDVAEAARMAVIMAATRGSRAAALVFGEQEVEGDESMDLDDDEEEDDNDDDGGVSGAGRGAADRNDASNDVTHLGRTSQSDSDIARDPLPNNLQGGRRRDSDDEDLAGAEATGFRIDGTIGFPASPSGSEDEDELHVEARDDEDDLAGAEATGFRIEGTMGFPATSSGSEVEDELHVEARDDDDDDDDNDDDDEMAPMPSRGGITLAEAAAEAMSSDDDEDDDDDDGGGSGWRYDALRAISGRATAFRGRAMATRGRAMALQSLPPRLRQSTPSLTPLAEPERDRDPTATLDPPIRRNYIPSGGDSEAYAPTPRESIGPIRLPSYLSLSRVEGRSGPASTGPASSFYTYVPASHPSASLSFPLPSSLPSTSSSLPISSLFSAPLTGGGTYHATSAFFPLDSTPGDLLGLDWDEWGERLFVATGERVWEWEVDARARRGSATWATL
ncbi:hypothetical protein C6P46_002274 [Rhodotorula mucilaginosa]|uniref:DUF2415 domain-containing protein n=1 Tax=Rhodotorula mucilaginosa TaxID=5537 RepID=A0A9P6W3K3_RHOMI|nr:hypothetical protein C6P46_002274 [Rhodotorula mucilaginosa]